MTSAPLILFGLAVVAESGSPTRIVEFVGGRTAIESEGGVDHVVVRDAKGNVTSESWCDSGRFSDYFTLFAKFRDAVLAGNRDATLRLIDYPFRVNGGKNSLLFKTPRSLSRSYDKVFTAAVQQKLRKAEPAAVSCRDGQAMFGDGVVWANRTGIAILNP